MRASFIFISLGLRELNSISLRVEVELKVLILLFTVRVVLEVKTNSISFESLSEFYCHLLVVESLVPGTKSVKLGTKWAPNQAKKGS